MQYLDRSYRTTLNGKTVYVEDNFDDHVVVITGLLQTFSKFGNNFKSATIGSVFELPTNLSAAQSVLLTQKLSEIIEEAQANTVCKFCTMGSGGASGHTMILHYDHASKQFTLLNSTKTDPEGTTQEPWYGELSRQCSKLEYKDSINPAFHNTGCIFSTIITELMLKNGVKVTQLPTTPNQELEKALMDATFHYIARFYDEPVNGKFSFSSSNQRRTDDFFHFIDKKMYNDKDIATPSKTAIKESIEKADIELAKLIRNCGGSLPEQSTAPSSGIIQSPSPAEGNQRGETGCLDWSSLCPTGMASCTNELLSGASDLWRQFCDQLSNLNCCNGTERS